MSLKHYLLVSFLTLFTLSAAGQLSLTENGIDFSDAENPFIGGYDFDTNASTSCGSNEVLTGDGCVARYNQSLDSDSSSTNELQNLLEVLSRGNNAGNTEIRNVSNPTSPRSVATKAYVDSGRTEPVDSRKVENSIDLNGNGLTSSSGEVCIGDQC